MKHKIKEFVKKHMKGTRKKHHDEYTDILHRLHKNKAYSYKKSLTTKEFHHITTKAGTRLKKLAKYDLVKRRRGASLSFIVDTSEDKEENRFKVTKDQIKEALEKNSRNLVKHGKENEEVEKIILEMLEIEKLSETLRKIDDAKDSIETYNEVVKKIKEKNIALQNYDELLWRHGKDRWWLTEHLPNHLGDKYYG